MALDIFYCNDIRRILIALASAGVERGAEYEQALRDVGLAVGVQIAPMRQWDMVNEKPEPIYRIPIGAS